MQIEVMGLPIVQILLVAIMFLAVLVEIKTGGMGLGTLLGIVAAAVFFGSQYVNGLVSFFEIAIFLGGVLCIGIEMLTPGVGIFAGIGIGAMLYSLVLSLGGTSEAIYAILLAVVIAIIMFALILKKLPSSRLWKKVLLTDTSTATRGYVSAKDYTYLLGKNGIALTELRPAGTAIIEEGPFDVVSEGTYIKRGEAITVIMVNGSRIVVRKKMKVENEQS